jgi:hypothetical protein
VITFHSLAEDDSLKNFDAAEIIWDFLNLIIETFKDKARADEKAQHTREYVSILRRSATP